MTVTSQETDLRTTPIHEWHVSAGARMVPFAGWSMPLRYASEMSEHRAVRAGAGLFDVSHMGRCELRGPGVAHAVQRVLSNDVGRCATPGSAQYTLLLNDNGGIDDDLILYHRGEDHWQVVVNAANREFDISRFAAVLEPAGCSIEDVTFDTAMFALQGPRSLDVCADLLADVRELKPFQIITASCAISPTESVPVDIATTGYTGERGVELVVAAEHAVSLWRMIVDDPRVVPVGLAARDTLRLEACYPLHGNDIGPDVTPLDAGLGWACGWDAEFPARDILQAVRSSGGPARTLVPLLCEGRGIPRPGCSVLNASGSQIGVTTSGSMSPILGTGIALAMLASDHSSVGTRCTIDVRGRPLHAAVVKRPFVQRSS